MVAGEDEAKPVEAVVDADESALTIYFRGSQFDGGRLPVSALATLERMNKMVVAIGRDLDLSSREDAVKASPLARFELVLVGEIGDGSAQVRALFVPIVVAATAVGLTAQADLLVRMPAAVSSIVQSVHEGSALSYPVSDDTLQLVADVGKSLGKEDQLELRPADGGTIEEAVDDNTATVTLTSTTVARQAREVSETRSFFVTGTIRQLENHGEEPGKLTLSTTSGLYPVPSVSGDLVERAAGLLSVDRNVVVAISGQGEFDGKGRLRKLTHLTEMSVIDRHFNPDTRLGELAGLTDSEDFKARSEVARIAIERAALRTGRAPGLFLDEDDQLEARWLIKTEPDAPEHVVNVTFGRRTEVYVFDRSVGVVTEEQSFDFDTPAPGDLIADIIERTVDGTGA